VYDGEPLGRLGLLRRLCVATFSSLRNDPSRSLGRLSKYEIHQITMWMKWEMAGIRGSHVPYFASRTDLLGAAARRAATDGLWLEFGVFNGATINLLARLTPLQVFGFDSFEGLPRDWTPELKRGAFALNGTLPAVRPNVTLVRGWYSNTLGTFLREHPEAPVTFLHVDCDLYESAVCVLLGLKERIREGTVIVFDEFEGLLPDTEGRAFREFVRATDRRFLYLGCSSTGSVAVQMGPRR
jgi:methyltransferase family protein